MTGLRDRFKTALRGGNQPLLVALAVGLGLLTGFASGVNLTFALLVWVAVALNVHTLTFIASWCVGLGLAITLHSICHGAGYALLDELGLGAVVTFLGESPFVALLDWDRYALVGGLGIGLLLAVPAARGAWTIVDARWRNRNEGALPRGALVRPLALVHSPVAAVVLVLLPWAMVERQLADELLSEAVQFADCHATADRTQLCLWTGKWTAENVWIESNADSSSTALRVDRIEASINPARLLRGWMHIDRLTLSGVSSGKLGNNPSADNAPRTGDATDLNEFVVGWCQRRDHLAWAGSLIATIEELSRFDQNRHLAGDKLMSAFTSTPDEPRSRLGHREPRVVVKELEIDDFSPLWRLGNKAVVKATYLTSNPRFATASTAVHVSAPEWSCEVDLAMNLSEAGQRHQVKFRAHDLPVAELLDPAQVRARLVVHRGLVSASGEGWIDQQRVYLPVALDCQQLSAQWLGNAPAGGVSTDSWNRGLRELGALRAEALLTGRWNDLRLVLESRELVNQFKHQLHGAGAHDLLAAIDQELAGPPKVVAHADVTTPATSDAPQVAKLPASESTPLAASPIETNLPATPVAAAPLSSNSTPGRYPSTETSPALVTTQSATEETSHSGHSFSRSERIASTKPSETIAPLPSSNNTSPYILRTPAPVEALADTTPATETTPATVTSLPTVTTPATSAPTALSANAVTNHWASPAGGVTTASDPRSPDSSQVSATVTASRLPTEYPSTSNYASTTSYGTASRPANGPVRISAPGPINMTTGPDIEGVYSRGRTGVIASNDSSKPAADSTAPASSGLSGWSRDMSSKMSSMFSKSKRAKPETKAEVADAIATLTPPAKSVSAAPVPAASAPISGGPATYNPPPRRTAVAATAMATDDPTDETAAKSDKSWYQFWKK